MNLKRCLPWMIAGAFAVWVIASLRMPAEKGFAFREFGRLPVISNGRTQPIESLARNSLLQLREKQTANLEPWKGNPKIISANEWVLTVMTRPEVADQWPVFRIDNPDVKGLLKVPGEKDTANKLDGKHFSWAQIQPRLDELRREASRANDIESARRSSYDQALLKLWNAQAIYVRLKYSLGPAAGGELTTSMAPYTQKIEAGRAAFVLRSKGEAFDDAAFIWFADQFETPLVIAGGKEGGHDQWMRAVEAAMQAVAIIGEPPHFSLAAYGEISSAYRADNPDGFNAAVARYQQKLADNVFTKELKKSRSEQYFNFIEPFYKAMVIVVCAFLLVLIYWFNPEKLEWARVAGVKLVVLALIVHTVGLVYRMVLEGRPPVTNLYSSAIFIGWGAMVLGLILERFWRNSIGLMVSCIIGFSTLIIAHHLRLSGDTMEMMRAVLDTNFWLATHVVVVTLGYAATFVAGILGAIYVLMGVFTRKLRSPMLTALDRGVGTTAGLALSPTAVTAAATAAESTTAMRGELGKSLARMIYGIICFAALFSFVGTVLGGIWADQSWGRFWGWDVKENGALIIVLWNALILHARWGGMVRERGLAVLAIGGNIVTSWSWFGVNMLGIGLHAYGFTGAAFRVLALFVGANMLLIVLGCLPSAMWASFRQAETAQPDDSKGSKPLPAA